MSKRVKVALGLVAVLLVVAAGALVAGRLGDKPANSRPLTDGSDDGNNSNNGGQTPVAVDETEYTSWSPPASGRLQLRLSEGQAQAQAATPLPLAAGTPLPPDEVVAILARLPLLEGEPEDQQEFNLPPTSLPAPRPGQTIQEPFPPPQSETAPGPPDADSAPPTSLEVVRYSPEGPVDVAPFLSVTFNQPMVALDTLAGLSEADVPVELTPELPGRWRWQGTQTLLFEYEGAGLPKATEYVVEVPAGVTSLNGQALDQAVTWKFFTPPPQVVRSQPQGGPHPRDPLFFIAFDQRIPTTSALEHITVKANGQPVAIRAATQQELEADDRGMFWLDDLPAETWIAFKAENLLPADATVEVVVEAGFPSAEGPRTTEAPQSYSFQTYAALRIEEEQCGWDECFPLTPFTIRFNNPLDDTAFDPTWITVEPDLPGADIYASGNTITIRGATQAQTTYRVTVDGAVQDIFGQTLGQAETLTFRVGSAPPSLIGPNRSLVTVDPSAPQAQLTVYSVNYSRLNVRAYAVQPSDWDAYQEYQRSYYQEQPAPPPGSLVLEETLRIPADEGALMETTIELGDALQGEFGHLVVVVEPPANLLEGLSSNRKPVIITWVQKTNIGLDAFTGLTETLVWTTDLRDGSPLSDVSVRLNNVEGQTGPDGTAMLDGNLAGMLVAQQGADVAFLPEVRVYGERGDEFRWYVFDDRGVYRPGEEVHIKGWVRRIEWDKTGSVSLPGEAANQISYWLDDPQGNRLAEGTVEPNSLGGFDLVFTLPENANLGYASLNLSLDGDLARGNYYHTFQIQEFRRPEFEVSASQETVPPYISGEHAVLVAEAAYYAGGPLPAADVTWRVSYSPGFYNPPGWPDFTFGVWQPWWGGPIFEGGFYESPVYYESEPMPPFPYDGGTMETFNGQTDAAGKHYLRLDFDNLEGPTPYSVHAEAAVMDVNRQTWTGSTQILVHPSSLYVGLKSERTFVQQGSPLEIRAIVVDLDGNAVAGRPVNVKAERVVWRSQRGQWREVVADSQDCTVTSAAEPVLCTFTTGLPGTYQITASVEDEQGRLHESTLTRWVGGGEQVPNRRLEAGEAVLIPDRETYAPGDVAEVLVQAPFSPADGLLTVSRNGILYHERFQVGEEGSAVLQVPIREEHIPNLHLTLELVGSAPRLDSNGQPLAGVPEQPAYATGHLRLDIPPVQRTLSVEVAPQTGALEPGAETAIDLRVADANGQPVAGAEVALVVVDEAILALTNYQLADPLPVFYPDRPPGVDTQLGRSSIVLVRPESLGEQMAEQIQATRTLEMEADTAMAVEEAAMEMPEAGAAPPTADDAAANPIRIRSNFDPLALFAPTVETGSDGRATVPLTLPDNLTRYRVMAVAVAGGTHYGTGESNLTARLPLMVRPSAPRFLNFGDQFGLPVVIQNNTDQIMEVDVAVQSSNLLLTEGSGRRVSVPANDRVEVRFPATTDRAGTARLQIAAVSGPYADAARIELPVYTPATTEAFATYGVVDEGAVAQAVAPPEAVFADFGGLEISTSSTALQGLTDAVLYLVTYPYECSEQLASRIMGIAALRDVLSAFEAEGLPDPQELEAAVDRDIERLVQMQNDDGGWPIWQRGDESVPFYSIHVTHALLRAQEKGFAVPQEPLARGLEHLRQIESYIPADYGQQARHTLLAYALYVRDLAGEQTAAEAAALLEQEELEDIAIAPLAWLWMALEDDPAYDAQSQAIYRHLLNRVVTTADRATFATSYSQEEGYLILHSNRRADALVLDALIQARPESDLIVGVVNELLAQRTRGRWSNTQENVFVLLALDHYFNTFEAQTPDFVARLWLGETYAGEHVYQGRSTDRHETDIPMSYLLEMGEQEPLIISKEGPGRLYYRLGLSYAPLDLSLPPLENGFAVERTYEALDDPGDVRQDDEGLWHIRAGARVRVRLTMVAPSSRYHVALVDPLPAGLEPINPALAGSDAGGGTNQEIAPRWWWWYWYNHQNLRDQRAEAFATRVWAGAYEYSYIARATTPGTFVAPPAKAEEMYHPEVFGRAATDWVIVE